MIQKGLLVLLLLYTAAVWSATPVDLYGNLSVSNKRIVDKNGAAVQLCGMSLYWSQWGDRFWTADIVKWLIKDWNIRIIRTAMAVEDGGYLTDSTKHKNLVKLIVNEAVAQGIYVIIDWHEHNATGHLEQAKAFFTDMAKTYGHTPNVIYEIFNEPDNETWADVKIYAEQVVSAIRAYDPDNLIIVGTPKWCQNVDQAAKDPVSGTNIVYALHFYAADHDDWLRQKAATALQSIPLIVSEWGTCEATGDGVLSYDETDKWVKFMNDNKISWCNWSIMALDETSAALKRGASYTGNWPDSMLSASGTLVRGYLRGYVPIQTPVYKQHSRQAELFLNEKDIRLVVEKKSSPTDIVLYDLRGREHLCTGAAERGLFIIPRKKLHPGIWLIRCGHQSIKMVLE